jgi:hypothetical protein
MWILGESHFVGIQQMSCPVSMSYDDTSKKYVAREKRGGATMGTFQTLASYNAYAASVGCMDVRYPEGTTFVPTGFLEFAARDPVTQAKYDAMSSTWEGVKPTEAAITKGLFDLDFAKGRKK